MTEMQVKECRRGVPQRKLEKSGRITPRQVLEAYEETGLEPATGLFLDGDQACAFGVLMVKDGINPNSTDGGVWLRAKDERLRSTYSPAFWEGFDGQKLAVWRSRRPEGRKGYRDGQRARRFVFGA